MKLDLRRPCAKCPFRRDSVRGWLGPWEPTELLFALGREAFPCHLTIPQDEGAVPETDDRLQGCAGAAIFLNNKIERSRHPVNAQHQALVENVPAEVKASVFNFGHEFIEHHTPFQRKKRAR